MQGNRGNKPDDQKPDTNSNPPPDDNNEEEDNAVDDEPADDQDDTEDSSDDSSNDSDDESDDSDDSDDTKGRQFIRNAIANPSSLPPDVRAAWKVLQGNYTRKMQEVGTIKRKAEAFDQILHDPAFIEWARDRENALAGGKVSKSRRASNNDDDDDEDTPLTRAQMREELARRDAVENARRMQEKYDREAEEFKQENPDWVVYEDDIIGILKDNPRLDFDDAYYLAKRRERQQTKTKDLNRMKKRANIQKPSRTEGREPLPPKPKKFKSVREAYEYTVEQIRLKNRRKGN